MKFKPLVVCLFAGIILVFSSCIPVTYNISYETPKALDIAHGQWLVNICNTGLSGKGNDLFHKKISSGLTKAGAQSFSFTGEVIFDYIIPEMLTFDTNQETLSLLKSSTKYNYLMNIRANQLEDDLNFLMPSPPDIYGISKSEIEITVYELNTGNLIYRQKTIASVSMDSDDDDTNFSKSAQTLIFNALDKALKEIKKYTPAH
ncbi:MAG: hypothetical protein JXB00_16945 [Bacteroidales bacterium]|nr:hypothetical protein [Bacteroidales bacterium]